jgi:uncharacterized protein
MWLILLIVVIGALFVLVRVYQAQLAFFPTRGENETPTSVGVPFTAETITTADGERLRLWHFPVERARAQVVYFHGNGGNLSLWLDLLVQLPRHGFEVVAVDYRGYGLSTGVPSETGLYRDVDAVLEFFRRIRRAGVPAIYWGRSLGTTMAAYAAAADKPDGVILESGFPSMRAVARSDPLLWALSWFSSYQFPTARWMARSQVPALVLHGDDDNVIPYALGRELYAQLSGPKQFVTIEGGDHNDAAPPNPDKYWQAIETFAHTLAASPVAHPMSRR